MTELLERRASSATYEAPLLASPSEKPIVYDVSVVVVVDQKTEIDGV